MIEEPKALSIQPPTRRPTDAQIAAFQGVPTGFVVDAMYGAGALAHNIVPLGDHALHAAGPALSVDNRPSDVLALLAAGSQVQAGDIVINAFAGYQGCAAAGDRVAGMLKNAGAVGFVTDGPMRDYAGIMEAGLPCWCTGLNPGSPFATGPGKIGTPIQIGGQHVCSGDMIVADRDGVVVVPFDQIAFVVSRLSVVAEAETALDAQVSDGLRVPPAIQDLLRNTDVLTQES